MRLTVDLRHSGAPVPSHDGERVVSLHELAASARRPDALMRQLRDRRFDEVRVLADDRPLSGVQAGALGLASLARTSSFAIERPSGTRRLDANAMLRHATGEVGRRLPAEAARVARLLVHAWRAAATDHDLPARPAGPVRRVAYLRAEPTLRYLGAHIGGAATHTVGVINGLRHAGVDVRVYAPEAPEGLEPDVAVQPVDVTRVTQLVPWLTLTDYARDL